MRDCDFLALEPRRSRLEWLGPIPATSDGAVALGPVARTLDYLDIIAAGALTALFAAIKR